MTTQPNDDVILVTGATGQVGTALCARMLKDPNTRVMALVRARDDAALQARLTQLRAHCGGDAERLLGVRGDVSAPGLGLDETARAMVASLVTSVVHAAASVRFDLPAKDAAQSNINAVTHVLDVARTLLERGRLRRLDHVSTAYVAGQHPGRFHEHDADIGQQFRNTYEWSKLQGELRVMAAMQQGLPAAIHRPSIVVGDSTSGATRAFNVLYWPLKVYVRGWWKTFPGSPDARVDIVPVDYVADRLARLRRNPATLGQTFHLAAGDAAKTVRQLAAHIETVTGGPPVRYMDQQRYRRFGRPLVAPFLAVTKRGRAILRGGEAYMPYFVHNPVFDTARLCSVLGPDAAAPPVLDYLERVVRFAMVEDFGDRAR